MTGRFKLERDAGVALTPPRPMAEIRAEAGPALPRICHVDGERLVLRDTYARQRALLAKGTVVLALVPLLFWARTWLAGRQATEAGMLCPLAEEITAFGTEYVRNEIDGGDRTLPLIWPDRTLSLLEYLQYELTLSGGGIASTLPVLAFVSVALLMGGIGLWLIRRMPGRAS